MKDFLDKYNLILTEAAVVERLKRRKDITLDDHIVHAHLIYDAAGKKALSEIYSGYISIANRAQKPIMLCTPTWRANQERVEKSKTTTAVNIDAVKYIQELKDRTNSQFPIKIGGLISCKHDCYSPEKGLSVSEAKCFHAWQIQQLISEKIDFLIAVTLPNVDEALGIAMAMEDTDKPYILSFVIGRDGRVLDGNSLGYTIDYIDSQTKRKPLGYFVNCSYPSFINPKDQPPSVFKRLIGIQANASSLDHCELDSSSDVKSEPVKAWGDLMVQLNQEYGVKVLGGCCGTDNEHLEFLAKN